jgi:hypothetical protein
LNLDVVSIDNHASTNPDLCVDIEAFQLTMLEAHGGTFFDIMTAGVPCPAWSHATHGHFDKDMNPLSSLAEQSIRQLEKVLEIYHNLKKINPRLRLYLENPKARMRKWPAMNEFRRLTTFYCQWGNDYRKPSDWFTDDMELELPEPECTHGGHPTDFIETSEYGRYPRALIDHILGQAVANIYEAGRGAPRLVDATKPQVATVREMMPVDATQANHDMTETETGWRYEAPVLGSVNGVHTTRAVAQRFGDSVNLPEEARNDSRRAFDDPTRMCSSDTVTAILTGPEAAPPMTGQPRRRHGRPPDDYVVMEYATATTGGGGDMVVTPSLHAAALGGLTPRPLPKNVLAKLNGPDRAVWQAALKKEVDGVTGNDTYTAGYSYGEVMQNGGRILHTLLSLSTKRSGAKKVRWCCDGKRQPADTYSHSTSTAASYSTFLTMVAAAASRGHKLVSVDFSTAFLNAPLEEDNLYVFLPLGLGLEGEGTYAKLNKSWYGLAQSSRNWQLFLEEELLKDKWEQDVKERGLYRKYMGTRKGDRTDPDNYCFAVVYVDDVALSGKTPELAWAAIDKLLRDYKCTKDPLCEDFLGIEVEQDDNGVTLHLAGKILKMAEEFNVMDDLPVHSPVMKTVPTADDSPEEDDTAHLAFMDAMPYNTAMGKMAWMADVVRYDILQQCNHLKKFVRNPGRAHWEAARHLMCYLKTTAYRGLHYARGASLQAMGYSDSDWGGAAKGRSVSGVVVMLAGAAVMAASTRQKCVAQSSFEGELIAAGNLAKMLMSLRDTLRFLLERQQATPLVCDNQTVIRFCNTPQWNGRTRHIASRYWLIDLLVEEGELEIAWVKGTENPADLMTKNCAKSLAVEHIDKMGFIDLRIEA